MQPTCSNCRQHVGWIQTVTLEEDLPNGSHESKEFCSTECLQKYRLRHVQFQRKEVNSSSLPSPSSSTTVNKNSMASLVTTSSSVTNGESKPLSVTTAPPSSITTPSTTITPTHPSPTSTNVTAEPSSSNNRNINEKLTINTKVVNEDVKSVTTSNDKPPSLISPAPLTVKCNEPSEADPSETLSDDHVSPNSVDSKKSDKKSKAMKQVKVVPKHHYETFSVFDWDNYLKEVGGEIAPPEAFKQSFPEIPVNEFRANMKLESKDPRNASSTSIATVIYNIGPRVCLRLDGGDNANDFFELVDSESIQPIGTCDKNGDMLQPPLGFQKNPSQWPIFVVNALQGAEIAPDRCFKKTPPSPKRNKFEVGMKLEAVDRKHPRMILPATVGDVKEDLIQVCFDGWNGAFDYWCDYRCRDIFPVGWCKKAGHPLQPPGDKAPTDKEKAKRMSTPSLMKINTGTVSPSANNGSSISPGSRRAAASSLPSPSLLSPKGVGSKQSSKVSNSNSNNKVSTASHGQNGTTSLKVPNLKISTTSGKVTSVNNVPVKGAVSDTNPKINVSASDHNVSSSSSLNKPRTKTTARKSTGGKFIPRVIPNNANQGNLSKTPVRRPAAHQAAARALIDDSDSDRNTDPDTDTEIEESPVKQSPVVHRIQPQQHHQRVQLNVATPLQHVSSQQQQQKHQQPVSSNINKRPVQDPPPRKLSEIRPAKVAKVANSNVSPSLLQTSVKTESSAPLATPNRNAIERQVTPNPPQTPTQSSITPKTKQSPVSSNYQDWGVEDVINYLATIDTTLDTPEITDAFKEHEIDGKAFVLLTSEMMTRYMHFKLGPMLKILNIIEKLTGRKMK